MVLNRGAAEPLGATEISRGAANFWTWLVFTGKSPGVPLISEFDRYLLVNCSQGCRQIVKKLRKDAANQTRLRNNALADPWQKQ